MGALTASKTQGNRNQPATARTTIVAAEIISRLRSSTRCSPRDILPSGSFRRREPVVPPAAWASLATGVNPPSTEGPVGHGTGPVGLVERRGGSVAPVGVVVLAGGRGLALVLL